MGWTDCLRARLGALGAMSLLALNLVAPGPAGAAPPTGGTVIVTVVDGSGNPLPGACFEIDTRAGGFVAVGCDLFDSRLDGTTTIGGVAAGDDVLTLVSLPHDELFGQSRPVAIVSGQTTRITIQLATAGDSIAVATVDDQGAPRWGACYAVFRTNQQGIGAAPVGQGCDRDDGTNDGRTTIGGLSNGSYAVVETSPPPGYAIAPPQTVTIAADRDASLTVTDTRGGGYAFVADVDASQDAVPGACFRVYADGGHGALGQLVTLRCDFDDGDNNGTTRLAGLPAGRYVVVQSRAVPGFARAGNASLTIAGDQDPTLVVSNPRLDTTRAEPPLRQNGGRPVSRPGSAQTALANPCRFQSVGQVTPRRTAGSSCPS